MNGSRFSSKWVIVLTLAVVVTSFVGGSGYGEYRASRTHALTTEIATNESPSIQHLAAARAELRDLQRLLNAHVLRASTAQGTEVESLKEVRQRLRDNLESYFSLPALRGERELWGRIDKELSDVDVLAGRILEETAARRYSAARTLLIGELPAAIDEESDAILSAIQINAARVQEVAGEIDGERRRRILWVFGLDGISVALAVALAVLALRTVSSKEALMRRRSEELEGFAGRVAHDLLSPIAAVEMSLASVARSEGARREASLARAQRGLARTRSLIDDLLGFAQAGARPLPGAMTPVTKVVEGVLEEMRQPAVERGVSIHVDLPPLPLAVRCAPGVLSSLLSNLMRNAIKHMGERPRREVKLSAWAVGARVRFEVSDSGPGLPSELGTRVFDPYVRGTGTAAPGLGLGLATVRRLVEGHDGRYGVDSQPGVGTLFWFELPAEPLSLERVEDQTPATGSSGAVSAEVGDARRPSAPH